MDSLDKEEVEKLKAQIKDANRVISAAKDMTNDGEGFCMIDQYYEDYNIEQ